jgi:hypothetical protein
VVPVAVAIEVVRPSSKSPTSSSLLEGKSGDDGALRGSASLDDSISSLGGATVSGID